MGCKQAEGTRKNAPVSGVPSVYLILSLRAGVISAPQAGRGKMKAPWARLGPPLGAPPAASPFVPGVTEPAGGQPQETVLGGRDGCDLVTQPLPFIRTKAAPRCGKTRAQSGVPIPSSHRPQVGCRTPPLPQLAPAFVLMLCSLDQPVKTQIPSRRIQPLLLPHLHSLLSILRFQSPVRLPNIHFSPTSHLVPGFHSLRA